MDDEDSEDKYKKINPIEIKVKLAWLKYTSLRNSIWPDSSILTRQTHRDDEKFDLI
jgi:hypothetical protein